MPELSIDLKARQVIMASWLYYEMNVSVMPDAEFDSLCQQVAAELEWFDAMGECGISPIRRVQLGEPDALKASGHHIKVTQASIGGAVAWYNYRRRRAFMKEPDLTGFEPVTIPEFDEPVLMRGLLG
ncbi:hypothetical protein FDH82_gp45 [Roseobacter phage RDJL Phi 2]|uniref:Uncharacterized protein n=1 Tax=Roseobacter phage RDJL Phi 2 TaxID=1682380 RepID=A0A0K0PVJ2_9CAUD|nr:hypothetical protein FDH82_gp45 [Roseobacter phage RDJL Phi 2]AKQ75835.1 hypothetical protein RDJLphi2_gp45 [Roseobacter phage RDJL Phi 2]